MKRNSKKTVKEKPVPSKRTRKKAVTDDSAEYYISDDDIKQLLQDETDETESTIDKIVKSKRKKKCSRFETTERVEKIIGYIINGLKTYQIMELICNEYGIAERTFYYFLNLAKNKLEKESDKRITTEYSKSLRRLEMLYIQSLQLMDFKTALAVQKEINEMLGIKQPVKHLLENKHIVEFIEIDETLTDENNSSS